MTTAASILPGPSTLAGSRPLDLSCDLLLPRLRPEASLTVLDITKFFGPTTGGIRTYLLEKSRYVQSREGLRHTVIVPGPIDDQSDENGVRWYHVRGRPIPTQHPYRFLLRSSTINRLISHESPDIIEVGSPWLIPWITQPIARRLHIPLVWFYHTNLPRIISPRPGSDRWGRRMAGKCAEAYIHRLRRVFHGAIAASNAAVRSLEQAGFERIEKVPLGVDLQHFHPDRRASKAETRARYNLPEGPLALYVGRLAREKELDLVIDAWPQVESRMGASLVLVGDGPSKEYFRGRCDARRVYWLPHEADRDRLADLIAAADLVIAPGPAETFGLAALEAMASGVPVLSSDQGAVRELIEASGSGEVNPYPQADAMAASVVHLFQQDLPRLGALGRRYAETSHSWSAVFDRLFNAYRRLLEDFQ
ncbi:MAG: glycosyltransferase [Gemmatimonadota bacterium]